MKHALHHKTAHAIHADIHRAGVKAARHPDVQALHHDITKKNTVLHPNKLARAANIIGNAAWGAGEGALGGSVAKSLLPKGLGAATPLVGGVVGGIHGAIRGHLYNKYGYDERVKNAERERQRFQHKKIESDMSTMTEDDIPITWPHMPYESPCHKWCCDVIHGTLGDLYDGVTYPE